MDEFDRAQEIELAQREAAIAACRANAERLLPTGECLACGEDVVTPKLFCNGHCASVFSARMRRK
jgi:hypothetical protein